MSQIAIMQPYFLPYIGYFQLMNTVDTFVVYDNIQYTKKGWINRNRFLLNGKDVYFTTPLKKGNDYLHIRDRYLADDYLKQNQKQLRKVASAYKKAPFYDEVMPLLSNCFLYESQNLFEFILNSILQIKKHLNIPTEIVISSSIEPEQNIQKGVDRVINICRLLSAQKYLNPIGGTALYSKQLFFDNHIQLNFLSTNSVEYNQQTDEFIPFLSIIDVLMFNGKKRTIEFLKDFSII